MRDYTHPPTVRNRERIDNSVFLTAPQVTRSAVPNTVTIHTILMSQKIKRYESAKVVFVQDAMKYKKTGVTVHLYPGWIEIEEENKLVTYPSRMIKNVTPAKDNQEASKQSRVA